MRKVLSFSALLLVVSASGISPAQARVNKQSCESLSEEVAKMLDLETVKTGTCRYLFSSSRTSGTLSFRQASRTQNRTCPKGCVQPRGSTCEVIASSRFARVVSTDGDARSVCRAAYAALTS